MFSETFTRALAQFLAKESSRREKWAEAVFEEAQIWEDLADVLESDPELRLIAVEIQAHVRKMRARGAELTGY